MKKIYLVGIIIVITTLILLGNSFWFGENEVTNAQVSDEKYQKLRERDKNVPQEKVDKAFAESKKIQDDIIAVIAEKKPKFKVERKAVDFVSTAGKRGVTNTQTTWQSNYTRVSVYFYLMLKKEGLGKEFWFGLNSISMGDFFKVPDIGDEAILVKNVSANKKDTGVDLHFIKGRAMVDVHLKNHKRPIEKNEKELMEIIRLIEPLIVARDNFDDE